MDIKNKKTILFKLGQFPHVSETFILSQIILAIDVGYDVQILVRQLMDVSILKNSSIAKKYDLLPKIIIEDYQIPENKWLRAFKSIFKIIFLLNDLRLLIKYCSSHSKFSLTHLYQFYFYRQFKRIDIIHVQYGTNVRPVDLLKSIGFLNGKLIISFHGHDAFFPINGIIPKEDYYTNAFKSADHIIANTNYLKDALMQIDCPKSLITVIHIPVDPIFFEAAPSFKEKRKQLRVITIGRLHEIKGHKLGIAAIKIVRSMGANVSLSIVGNGPEHQNLKEMILQQNLENEIFLLGEIKHDDVRDLLDEHDIYIATSIPTENGRRETQGIATIEAQARGLPVIAFNSGGIKYTFKNNESGYLVPEYDVEALATKIFQLATDPENRETMGENAMKFAHSKFSLRIIKDQWLSLYNSQ
jgi:colanic acid/amylovoran biosynthesis glycosyltransferase